MCASSQQPVPSMCVHTGQQRVLSKCLYGDSNVLCLNGCIETANCPVQMCALRQQHVLSKCVHGDSNMSLCNWDLQNRCLALKVLQLLNQFIRVTTPYSNTTYIYILLPRAWCELMQELTSSFCKAMVWGVCCSPPSNTHFASHWWSLNPNGDGHVLQQLSYLVGWQLFQFYNF